jgi:hypothetical protein
MRYDGRKRAGIRCEDPDAHLNRSLARAADTGIKTLSAPQGGEGELGARGPSAAMRVTG